MRKIDVVLLSALILYDYSAQSLVDSDIINLGSSFIMENDSFRDTKLADRSFLPDHYDGAFGETDAEQVNQFDVPPTPVTNIPYHVLAKINPATAAMQPENDNSSMVIHISTPDPFMEEAQMFSESMELAAEETTTALSAATVSASFNSLSSLENIEVKDEVNGGNIQFADTDADGMFNFEDKCPAVAGVARFEGCPVPDSDSDGINDEDDRCPFEAGSVAASGCSAEDGIHPIYTTNDVSSDQPDASTFLTAVTFEKNSDVLSNSDFNVVLQLADKILSNAGAKVDIFKSADINSAAQANTVVRYLNDLGVKNVQINISAKNTGANAFTGGVEVQIRY
ncbi:hypothetical protein [Agriterribacter sp.]|uniref:hypothetical protein n=1 Tax=Agriterribacter sp. TaxID=2821509 RepID=UPI002B6FA589|nr:hypothetical protein [Agriterribacter sp.]HTN06396.1 hypothetical protein [Agriterribacter sp.]